MRHAMQCSGQCGSVMPGAAEGGGRNAKTGEREPGGRQTALMHETNSPL